MNQNKKVLLLCEHNPLPPTPAVGKLKRMDDKDRAELGLPPLLRERGNRNFFDFEEVMQESDRTHGERNIFSAAEDMRDAIKLAYAFNNGKIFVKVPGL